MKQPRRRFPKPWMVKEHPDSFAVMDASGFVLTRFYYEEDEQRRNISKRLTRDEAHRFAKAFAGYPDLVEEVKALRAGREGIDPG